MKDFIQKYSLSKTLRFELRPVGETSEKIKDFKNQALTSIVEQDRKRAMDYKEIKKTIDDYHRYFIEQVLFQKILTESEIQNAFDGYVKYKGDPKDESAKNTYTSIQKTLRKKIANTFNDNFQDYNLFDDALINEKGSAKNRTKPKLWQWLKEKLDSKNISQENFDRTENLIKNFSRFFTYFTGFNENRKNIYSAEEHQTAISYRIINENMAKHFDNCIKFENIRQNHKPLYDILIDCEKCFMPTVFNGCINQNDIDKYNEQIGHKSDDITAKGVNQLINEYRQKNNIENRKLPTMTILYKQILSDVPDSFKIDEFKTDKQLLETINEFYRDIQTDLRDLKDCLSKYLINSNLEKIYVKKDISLTDISNKLFADWTVIGKALEKYAFEILQLNKVKAEKWLKQDCFSIDEVQKAINNYLNGLEEKKTAKKLAEYFIDFIIDKQDLVNQIEKAYQQAAQILILKEIDKDRREPQNNKEGGKGFLQVEKIKNLLDSIMQVVHFVKPLYLIKGGKTIEVAEKDTDFYNIFEPLYKKIAMVINIYNKTRNYLTKKPYSTEKFKINFDNSTLLDGWDVNKETDNSAVILLKDGRYYLGIMKKDSRDLFDYRDDLEDSLKKQQAKEQLRGKIITNSLEPYYEKMIYKLLPDPSKMLPKVIFAVSNIEYYKPSDRILEIRENGLHKKEANNQQAIFEWIDFLKESIKKHPEWKQYFNFKFSPTQSYSDTSQFYKEVADQGYNIAFDKIKASYIDEKIDTGELYLFEIYSKDFSEFSKGSPNLHTSYWKLLFSKENLDNLVLKLNGRAEIFFRPASLDKTKTILHNAKQPINNKNPLNHKKQSTFDYDITKDKRYTKDKFFFHCPITLNFRAPSVSRFNDDVNEYLKNNTDINIIGIDRGERHLLYYSVINQQGSIIEQDSFNTITNSYKSNGQNIDKTTDYHRLLDEKESQRDAARKSWSAIENIKELKSGYLSHIVHKIAQLMIKYNAVVVLEDLNFGFKRGRFKVEKQVYQKFEKALIDKLNYLVFKDRPSSEKQGHYLSAYQLTAPFESFQKLGKQSGFLYYVMSNYTSKIDPVTGFTNLLDTRYENMVKSQEFFRKFSRICFNPVKDYFEFSFDYTNFTEKAGKKTKWTICTAGKERYKYNAKDKTYNCYDITAELKTLFAEYDIGYVNSENLVNVISNIDQADFFKKLLFLLGLTLQLRHSYKNSREELDFILSPVADAKGNFFDSRFAKDNQPKDADGNGAFNIARKGLIVLSQINAKGKPDIIRNKDWFDFVQLKDLSN